MDDWLWWFVVAGPVGAVFVVVGMLGWRAGKIGFGNIMAGWGILAVFGPPLVTAVMWLLVGDGAPAGGHERWPYATAAAILSIGLVAVATPIVVVVAVVWALTEER